MTYHTEQNPAGKWRRPIATYSIVARDESGSMGVAVQSHWFSVGSMVPYIESGVGAVATQSVPNPSHGPRALELLRSGEEPAIVLEHLLDGDSEREFRQIGIVDHLGRVAGYTGENCIPEAGHLIGEQYSIQANIMGEASVWRAMADAFEAADGDLTERLMTALEAAETEGGDIRGKQSAAMVVVRPQPTGIASQDRLFDLRVEDHPDPLRELARLIQLRRAYIALIEGDEFLSKNDFEAALSAYQAASEMVSDSATGGEAAFWTGIAFAAEGRIDEASVYMRRAQRQWDGWVRLVPRLTASGIISDDDLAERLRIAMVGTDD
jgi:uncharacterized Ntn-hydrolase superfamily protein